MNIAMLIARLIVGLGIAAHGSQKLFGWFHGPGLKGTTAWLESLGYRPGTIYALGAGLGEFLGGILVTLGFLSGIGPGLVILVMLVAILTIHISKGFFNENGGWELPGVYIAAALAFDFGGFGLYSVDRYMHLPLYSLKVRWIILGAAVIVALLNFATRRRKGSAAAAV
jgi:putative oxidoreductase